MGLGPRFVLGLKNFRHGSSLFANSTRTVDPACYALLDGRHDRLFWILCMALLSEYVKDS